jgi:hypothetical protein
LGTNAPRYRNHVYRGLNYHVKLLSLSALPADAALAWAVHDLGLFTADWDYLGPSVQHLAELAPEYGIADTERAQQMIQFHHKLRPCADQWVESFRIADRIDVSHGLVRGPLTRLDISPVVKAFPYLGFHTLLVQTATRWATKHPTRPMPMLRW